MIKQSIIFPPEWFPQSAIQLTWPHKGTDWAPILHEVIPCFVAIAKEVVKREKLLIVCHDESEVRQQLGDIDTEKIIFREIETNDTWARDHAPISVFENDQPTLYNFVFNGWGMKFPADKDNLITPQLYITNTFSEDIQYANLSPFVLEGGSVESDGKGTIMTTTECLLSVNRNDYLDQEQLEYHLKELFGADRILWINFGYLAGDDTDSHIDTLARFCNEDTIAYVQCTDIEDEHYEELKKMEEELHSFTQLNGQAYTLIPLPMADEVIWEGERLPATYANFLIMNDAVLLPYYGSAKDEIAKEALRKAFPGREILGINCLPLIKQHGSLHCVTMQYPEGFMNKTE